MKTIQELIEEGIKIKTTCAQTNIQTIVRDVYKRQDISPTRFPMEVKNAFIIVTLFATNHSASPSRIRDVYKRQVIIVTAIS